MKNRRILAAVLLIAILCVGVGYAAVADTINFTGTIKYDGPSLQLVWGNVTEGNALLTDPTGTGTDNFTVTLDTTEWNVDETKTFKVEVLNETNFTATNVKVDALTITDVDTYYDVTATIDSTTIAANTGKAIVTITVTMTDYPAAAVNANFTFQVTAEQGT